MRGPGWPWPRTASARPSRLLAGVLNPLLTPAVRAWLPRLLPAEHRLTAFALESTLQELVFVAGPVLAAAVAVAGGVPGAPGRLLTPDVWRLLAGGAGFLWVLSIAAVAIVAHVSGPQAQGAAGLYLALTSAGSMAGGLVFAARVRHGSAPAMRFVVLGVAVVALAAVMLTAATALLVVAAVAYGTAIAPVGTVLFGRLSEEAGDERAVEAFGWMGAAMGAGAVLGDASGGWLVTVVPPWAALAAAAVVAVGTAAVVRSQRCRGGSPG
jgi:MFS family permease